MIDAALLPLQRRSAQRAGAPIGGARRQATDQVTLAGFLFGVLSLPALAYGMYGTAAGPDRA